MNHVALHSPLLHYLEKHLHRCRLKEIKLLGNEWTQEQLDAAHTADGHMIDWLLNNRYPLYSSQFHGSGSRTKKLMKDYRAWAKRLTAEKIRLYGVLPPNKNDPFADPFTECSVSPDYNLIGDAYVNWRKGIYARLRDREELQKAVESETLRSPYQPDIPVKTKTKVKKAKAKVKGALATRSSRRLAKLPVEYKLLEEVGK